MGPTIILDKSALQALSENEINILNKYYYINIPGILIKEILGDLHKPLITSGLEKNQSIILAKKISLLNSTINIYYRDLLIGDLLGEQVFINAFRPYVLSRPPVVNSEGEKIVYLEQSWEEIQLEKWKSGDFSSEDELISQKYKEMTANIDLDKFKKEMANLLSGLKKFTTIVQISNYIDNLFNDHEMQEIILNNLFTEFNINIDMQLETRKRWNAKGKPFIIEFSAYSFYCLKVRFIFIIALINNVISTRPTNIIDLEYLYYLPFCWVISSNDKFHKKLIYSLLNNSQFFFDGIKLKNDLKKIVNERNKIKCEIEKTEWDNNYKDFPPQHIDTLTLKICDKYFKYINSLDIHLNIKQDEDIDCIIHERFVNINSLCFCGSGKKLRDCHLKGKI